MRVLSDPTLARSARGAVATCPCCGDPVLQFCDTRVTVRPAELRAMLRTVRAICAAADRPGACWGWALRAHTAREHVTFRLSADDAFELHALLDEAAATLALDALLVEAFQTEPS